MGALGAVIVAAGTGSRMNSAMKKQFLLLGGKPVFVHAIAAFEQLDELGEIVLVTGAGDIETCKSYVCEHGLQKVTSIVEGGAERQHSVRRGLKELSSDTEWVLVHDAARPFVTTERIEACWRGAERTGAAVLAVPVKDTVKVVDEQGWIRATLDRKTLWAIQTPQAFRLSELLAAHDKAECDGFLGTDDAMLVERAGGRVRVVQGDDSNIKITTPADWRMADYLWRQRVNGIDDESRSGV